MQVLLARRANGLRWVAGMGWLSHWGLPTPREVDVPPWLKRGRRCSRTVTVDKSTVDTRSSGSTRQMQKQEMGNEMETDGEHRTRVEVTLSGTSFVWMLRGKSAFIDSRR